MLFDVLTPQLVTTELKAQTKQEVIVELLDLLCSTGKVKDRTLAERDLWANEQRAVTGMQHGIAIPHAKTEAVDDLLACVAVSRRPVEFGSLDGKPSHIFVMMLSPRLQTGVHMRFLAEIGRLLKNKKVRRALLEADGPDTVLHVLTG
jgi:mannitol/fructose-specific phosphotransferase system IIA component (Ntr-type)